MVAEVSAFLPMFLLLFFNTSTAQGKGELVTSTDGEYGVIKLLHSKDVHQSHTKVMMDILITWVSANEQKPYRVFFVLVEPWVKTHDIGILYLFTLLCFGIQRGCTRSATKECISGVQHLHHVQNSCNGWSVFLSSANSLSHFSMTVQPACRSISNFLCLASYTSCTVLSRWQFLRRSRFL